MNDVAVAIDDDGADDAPPPLDAAALALAEGFAHHVARWARRLQPAPEDGSVEALRQAALQLSLATAQGHVCVELHTLAPTLLPALPVVALRTLLLGSGLVGTPAAPLARPLVLDQSGRLYLHRHFDQERRLARRLRRALAAPPFEVGEAARQRLRQLFPADPGAAAPDWQQLAAAMALRQRLTVISGGPGTGKTTTVLRLLAGLLAQQPGCRIALAAPTGKAAARLADAVRQQAATLPTALRAGLPDGSFTVHRLLGMRPDGSALHDRTNPLALDLLVVDEASMLDLALAARLFDAVPEAARIVLLGDKDQLAAVEAGAVFSELGADPALGDAQRHELAALCGVAPDSIVPPVPARPGALHDAVVWFTRNHRFAAGSGIGRLAADINGNRAAAAIAALREGADPALTWLEDQGAAPGAAAMAALHEGYAPFLHAVRQALAAPADDAAARASVFEAFARFRALCAVRQGPRGVPALNDALAQHARDALPAAVPAGSPWFAGRPVIVRRNDPLLKLFNGDIGITLPAPADGSAGDPAGLAVWFPDEAGGQRALAPSRLPPHETAFAMTVHKSQGSEFDAVLVMLPQRPGRVLGRELLYTAVTRARHRVLLCAGAEVLAAAIGAPTRRHGGLQARLAEAAAEIGHDAAPVVATSDPAPEPPAP